MGTLQVKGIRLHGNHGCIEEESLTGTHFVVDVTLKADFSEAERSDQLEHAFDYVEITQEVRKGFEQRAHLIEHVAQRIADRLATRYSVATFIEVSITKVRPPIEFDVDCVTYTAHRSNG